MTDQECQGQQNAQQELVQSIGADRLGKDCDAFYEQLVAAHNGLTAELSARLNARLVLILANQIGDDETLTKILDAARLKLDV